MARTTRKAQPEPDKPSSRIVKLTIQPEFWEALQVWGVKQHGRLWHRLPTTEQILLAAETGIDFQHPQT